MRPCDHCGAETSWPLVPGRYTLCTECFSWWSTTLEGRAWALGVRIDNLGAEIKRGHPWAWRIYQVKTMPHNIRRKVDAALPCWAFGHKWQDSLARTSKRCVRCGRVEMGDPLKGLLKGWLR